jgi:hypothetical protein
VMKLSPMFPVGIWSFHSRNFQRNIKSCSDH